MRYFWLLLPLITLIILPFAVANFGEDGIVGGARVIAGDELVIDGRRIHLYGVRAPGLNQSCVTSSEPWHCGRDAMVALSRIIDKRRVTCAQIDDSTEGRIEAVCKVANMNLNQTIIEAGWALADLNVSTEYKGSENLARLNKKGIWRDGKGWLLK